MIKSDEAAVAASGAEGAPNSSDEIYQNGIYQEDSTFGGLEPIVPDIGEIVDSCEKHYNQAACQKMQALQQEEAGEPREVNFNMPVVEASQASVVSVVSVCMAIPKNVEYEEQHYTSLLSAKRFLADVACESYDVVEAPETSRGTQMNTDRQTPAAAIEIPAESPRKRKKQKRAAQAPPPPAAPPAPSCAASAATSPADSSSPLTKPALIFSELTSGTFPVTRKGSALHVRADGEEFVDLIDRISQDGYARKNTKVSAALTVQQLARDNNPKFLSWSIKKKLLGPKIAGPFNAAWGPQPKKNEYVYQKDVMKHLDSAGIIPTGALPPSSTKDTFGWADLKRTGWKVWEMILVRTKENAAEYDRLLESLK